jgi:hypothetical protein
VAQRTASATLTIRTGDDVMQEQATDGHRWLQQIVGAWTFESTCIMGPDQPPMTGTGRETVRAFGDLWVMGDGEMAGPDGSPMRTLITLGFDRRTKRFVGSFVATAMTSIWVYDGELNASGRVLTLNTTGPSFTKEGEVAAYRDIVELHPDGRRLLRSEYQDDDGRWHEFMRAVYTRVAG